MPPYGTKRCANCGLFRDSSYFTKNGECLTCSRKPSKPLLVATAKPKKMVAKKAVKNPTRKQHYEAGKHWYVVTKGEFPHMSVSECAVCKRSVQPGQVVYIDKKQARAGSAYEPWFVMHKECMSDTLNSAPASTYDEIKERLAAGGGLFE